MEYENLCHTPLSPVSFLRRSAYIYPDKTAIIYRDRHYSYREFEERVNRLCSRLRAEGLRKNDRVAFLSPNIPPMIEAHFAVPAAGGILVAINTRLNAQEVKYIVEHSGARWLFFDDECTPLVASIDTAGVNLVCIADTGAPGDPYEDFLAGGSPEPVPNWLEDEQELIAINYTSGTTGQPKGVMFSHRGVYLSAITQSVEIGLNSDSTYMWALPMFHCNGWCLTWGVTAMSGTHICLRKIDPAEIWQLLIEKGVTHYCGSPTLQIMLMNDPSARRLERTVTTCVAGAPPSPTLLGQLKARNLRPIHVYGLTETYGPTTSCAWHREWDTLPDEEQATMLARQGQAMLGSDIVRVVDVDMNDIPRDGKTMGEVVMRGNFVMKGYYSEPEATAKAFSGGWFHSGDLGVWHPDGYIELRDRSKDIIISGGENISTIEVEQVVAKHPAVLECAIVAIPDEKWGERPKAFVTLRTDLSATQEEILAFCRERLAHYKCPVAIEFGPLPKTATGKVQKFVLRQKEWTGYEKRIH